MTTEKDIVERLRAKHDYERKHDAPADPLWKEAAAEIVRLRGALAATQKPPSQSPKGLAENDRRHPRGPVFVPRP